MLHFLNALGAASLGGTAAILLLACLSPLLARRFAPTVRLGAWRVLAALMVLVPCLSVLLGAVLPLLPGTGAVPLTGPVQIPAPAALEETAYRGQEDYDRDRVNATVQGYRVAGGELGQGGYTLHMKKEDGQELVIRDNWYQRTVTENGISTRSVHWSSLLLLVWALGAGIHGIFLWGSYALYRRKILRWAVPAGAEERAVLEEQAGAIGVKRVPQLFRCPMIHSPLVMGLRNSVILLPEKMNVQALGPVLAHELTHLREGHLRDKRLFFFCRGFHWFNPFVWWMARRAEQDLELCCDWTLVHDRDRRERQAYGESILAQMTAVRRESSPLTTGFSGSRAEMMCRFRAIVDLTPKRPGRVVVAVLACVMLLSQTLVSFRSAGAESGGGIRLEMEVQFYDTDRDNFIEIPRLAGAEDNADLQAINEDLAQLRETYRDVLEAAPEDRDDSLQGHFCSLYPARTDRYLSLLLFHEFHGPMQSNSLGDHGFLTEVYDLEEGREKKETAYPYRAGDLFSGPVSVCPGGVESMRAVGGTARFRENLSGFLIFA